jgi:hypothetical protein
LKTFLLLICSLFLYADPGVDTLALPKYTAMVKESLPVGWWFSSFAETFGDGIKAIDEVNATGKPRGFRIQLLWSDTHTFGDKDIPKIIELSKRVQAITLKRPNIKCEISPFCEHNLQNPDKYLDIVALHAPNCTPVNTVWKGALSKKYKNEVHGSKANVPSGRFNWSGDGEDAFNSDIEASKAKFRQAEVFWFWTCTINGKYKCADKTPRPDRKGWISKTEFEALLYLTNSKGNASLDPKWLFKAVSDKHTPECKGKDCKPVMISPIKTSVIDLTLNGKIVAQMPYYGTFDGGGYRYYAKDYGYRISQKHGNQLLRVVVKNKSYGTVNPAFRQNKYR